MQQKEPKYRILKGLSLSVSMALLCGTYSHAAMADNSGSVTLPQKHVSTAKSKSLKNPSHHKRHAHASHHTLTKTAHASHTPHELSESFRVSAKLPPNYLKNNGDVDYAIKLVNYIDYSTTTGPVPVGQAAYQNTSSSSTPHKLPAEQVNLIANGPHIAKYEPEQPNSAPVLTPPVEVAEQVPAQKRTPVVQSVAIQPAQPQSLSVAGRDKPTPYGTVRFLDAPAGTMQASAAEYTPQSVRNVPVESPVRTARTAPVYNRSSATRTAAAAINPASQYQQAPGPAEPRIVASDLPQLSQSPSPLPPTAPVQHTIEESAAIAEPVDRKGQLSANLSNPQTMSSNLPWLSQKNARPVLVASAEQPVTQSVRIEPLEASNTSVLPVGADDPNIAPHLIPPSMPSSVPPPQTPFMQKNPATNNAASGISEQSQEIVDHLPPEKIQHHTTPKPVDINHQAKNQFEEYMQEKSHNGEGIKISVRQPKENIAKMLDTAYDDLIAGDQENAISLYRQVLVVEPENKLALFGLATTYHRAGQTDMARPLYAKLLAIDPYNVEGLNNFLVLLSDESPKGALGELNKLEQSHPGFSPIPAQIAIIYEKMGNYDMAAKKMDAAISLSPENLKYRYDMAIILDKKGDWADAAVLYKELLTASDRGEKISADPEEIQQRLTFILSNRPKG